MYQTVSEQSYTANMNARFRYSRAWQRHKKCRCRSKTNTSITHQGILNPKAARRKKYYIEHSKIRSQYWGRTLRSKIIMTMCPTLSGSVCASVLKHLMVWNILHYTGIVITSLRRECWLLCYVCPIRHCLFTLHLGVIGRLCSVIVAFHYVNTPV